MNPVHLSIVTTLYRSAAYVDEFYRRCCATAEQITPHFEIIFVDDGSPDASLEIAVDLFRRDPRVRVFGLSRNFGHHKAMMTALRQARGEMVLLIDVDLEIGPEVLTALHARLMQGDVDVVYGVQDVRQDGLLGRIAGRMFYTAFNWLSSDHLPVNLTTVRLMTRRYVRSLVRHREREMIIAGLWVITGYRQVPLLVPKANKGKSSYTIARRFGIAANAVTSFSNRPLVFIFYLGLSIFVLSVLIGLDLLGRRLLFGTIASGWLSMILSMWALGGLIIFCLGIIGIYLSKVFIETKKRPYAIVRDVYDRVAADGRIREEDPSHRGPAAVR